MINRESNASSIPELTGFNVSHSALTRQVFLYATFTDNMASVPHWPLKEFPDLFCCISRDRAEALLHQLQRAIDYLDAGMDSPSLFLIDDDLWCGAIAIDGFHIDTNHRGNLLPAGSVHQHLAAAFHYLSGHNPAAAAYSPLLPRSG